MTRPVRILGAAAAFVMAGTGAEHLQAQEWATLNQARQVSGEEALSASVRYGAGELRIRPADTGSLYRLHLRYDEGSFQPDVSYSPGSLSVGVGQSDSSPRRLGSDRAGELDLALPRDVPTDLDLEFGAVRADLDLGGVRLRSLNLSTGASDSRMDVAEPNVQRLEEARFQVGAARFEAVSLANLNADQIAVEAGVGDLTLDFGGEWSRERTVGLSVEMGLGSLTIRVPEGVGIRVVRETLLMPLEAPDLRDRGDDRISDDWDSADHRLDISVSGAFGRIRIVRPD